MARWRLVAAGLALGYGALALFLLKKTLALRAGTAGTIDVCSTLLGQGCDRVLGAQTSWVLGVPPAAWGMVAAAMVLTCLLLDVLQGEPVRRAARPLAWSVAGLAAVGGLVLAGGMLVGQTPLCPLCLVAHGLALLLWFALTKLAGGLKPALASLGAAGRWLAGKEGDAAADGRWQSLGVAVVCLVGIATYQWLLIEARSHPKSTLPPPDELIEGFLQETQHDIPVGADDPVDGPADAPVTMVIFSNFSCPGCAELAADMPGLQERVGDAVRIVFKHYPLGYACDEGNWSKTQPVCRAAWVGEAARRAGGFAAYRQRMFEGKYLLTDILLDEELRAMKLTRADADKADVRAKVASDIAIGRKLGIDATPSVYLNGRFVEFLDPNVLVTLIQHLAEKP